MVDDKIMGFRLIPKFHIVGEKRDNKTDLLEIIIIIIIIILQVPLRLNCVVV